ncbi:hypothetical protein HPB47_001582 [Ixodes persulcatus]|uniref:Uncharacterized protein n=1 Tax=Ixodes persulcatus TaxID=34615 RepID=A0AC60PPS8_IXOPE|nr:hypothetical protein HPB47_001582 [Ixodes persulcatus]
MAGKKRKCKGSRCCVAGCSNYQLNSPGILFHRFPSDNERRKLWTDALYLWDPEKSLSPTARILICSDHFLPECYERNMRVLADSGFSTKYAKLRPDAVLLSDSSCNQNTFSLRDREISRGISLVAQCPHDARCVHSLYPDRVAVAVIRNNAVVSIGVAWVHLHGGYWNYVIKIQSTERSHHTSY